MVKTSQEIGIKELRDSDIVIFLISPYYGSPITKCKIEDCKAECPMKNQHDEISYTHCEYKVALAENKPHQAYLVGENWDVVKELKDWNSLDWRKIWENEVFKGLGKEEIEHYFRVAKKVWKFREEARLEFCPLIEDFKAITDHLAKNIIKWYSEGSISLDDFCGRRKELNDLFEKMRETVEVHGVGGVGKTTLVHVALLIQKLRGKKPATVGTSQSYLTGSGYKYFREKCSETQHEIVRNTITLGDVIDALSLPEEVRIKDAKEKINTILDTIEKENMILFIDDFQLADKDVKELVRNAKEMVISSRRKTGIAKNEIPLIGIEKEDRNELIKLITKRFSKKIGKDAKKKIKKIAEGHPVSTEILVRNSEKIDFQELQQYKNGLNFSNPEHVEEFLKRVVKEVLSEEAFALLTNLSVMNTDLENNLDKATIGQAYAISGFQKYFAELVDAGMLKKKEEKEGIYQFSYRHIQDAIKDDENKESHKRAIEYYRIKNERFGESRDDFVESLFHRTKLNPDKDSVSLFGLASVITKPIHSCFRRLFDIGEELRDCSKGNYKALVSSTLGRLYCELRRFEDSEKVYKEALKIYRRLAKENPDAYLHELATILNNLGILYDKLRRFEDAEKVYKEALKIYRRLAKENPDAYLHVLLQLQANVGLLYIDTNRTHEAIDIFEKILEKRDLLPDFGAKIFGKLGRTYEKLQYPENATQNYLFASVNYFILFRKGVDCLNDVLHYLEKVVELGDGEVKGDAELMITAIRRLAGEKVSIPQVSLSERGKALNEALNGRRVGFQPENVIDLMVSNLIKDILSLKD